MSHRYQLYMVSLLVVAVTLVTLWFAYALLFDKIRLYSETIAAHRREIQLLHLRMQYLPFFQHEAARVERELGRLKERTSFSSGFEFLTFLDEVASDTGNAMTVSVEEIPDIAVNVQLEGSFNGLLDFLLLMERTQTDILLHRITASSEGVIKTELLLRPLINRS